MKKLLIILLGFLIVLSACTSTVKDDRTEKQKDICSVDSDCGYAWFTGGCHTPEYVSYVMDKCRDGRGPCPSEAPPRENVTCTCEENSCVTHG